LQHLEKTIQSDDSKAASQKVVIGDNAYVFSETLLTPFSGLEKDEQRMHSIFI